jgi:hypothetical protein
MPGGDRRVYKLTDLFAKDELNRAMKLFIECRNTRENFRQRCTKEVVEPIISRVNACAGYDASPASLVYRLEVYLRALRGEERVTRHKIRAKQSSYSNSLKTEDQEVSVSHGSDTSRFTTTEERGSRLSDLHT